MSTNPLPPVAGTLVPTDEAAALRRIADALETVAAAVDALTRGGTITVRRQTPARSESK